MLTGNEFQTLGAENRKARDPLMYLCTYLLTTLCYLCDGVIINDDDVHLTFTIKLLQLLL